MNAKPTPLPALFSAQAEALQKRWTSLADKALGYPKLRPLYAMLEQAFDRLRDRDTQADRDRKILATVGVMLDELEESMLTPPAKDEKYSQPTSRGFADDVKALRIRREQLCKDRSPGRATSPNDPESLVGPVRLIAAELVAWLEDSHDGDTSAQAACYVADIVFDALAAWDGRNLAFAKWAQAVRQKKTDLPQARLDFWQSCEAVLCLAQHASTLMRLLQADGLGHDKMEAYSKTLAVLTAKGVADAVTFSKSEDLLAQRVRASAERTRSASTPNSRDETLVPAVASPGGGRSPLSKLVGSVSAAELGTC